MQRSDIGFNRLKLIDYEMTRLIIKYHKHKLIRTIQECHIWGKNENVGLSPVYGYRARHASALGVVNSQNKAFCRKTGQIWNTRNINTQTQMGDTHNTPRSTLDTVHCTVSLSEVFVARLYNIENQTQQRENHKKQQHLRV